MATPIPTGYTIEFVSTPIQAVVDAQNNLLDTVNHYFYYMNDVNWNKIDVVSKTILASDVTSTNSPGGADVISIAPTGSIWFHQQVSGTPAQQLALKLNPSTFATVSTFNMSSSWGYVQQTYLGNLVSPGLCTQWPTQDGKIVFCCAWGNASTSVAKPPPFVGAFDATTLTSIGTYNITLPVGTPATYFLYQPPNGNYYVNISSNVQIIPILDEAGHAYILGKTIRQGTSVPIVYDWYIWKVDLSTMAGTAWHFVGDVTVGLGTSMLYDAASNSLLVQSTTGYLFVVDCATGTLTNTVASLFGSSVLSVIQTQGKTQNGVFFTTNGTIVSNFIVSSGFVNEGTFVDTSGVTWGGSGAGFDWTYDPTLNYIVVPTGNNYPPVSGTQKATLIYKLASSAPVVGITQVFGGNFQDCQANPVANGYLTVRLISDSEQATTGNGEVYSGVRKVLHLDMTGNVAGTEYLWANSLLNPANSYYVFQLFDATGIQLWQAPLTGVIPSQPMYNLAGLIRN